MLTRLSTRFTPVQPPKPWQFLFLVAAGWASLGLAEVKLPRIFTDGMVLQRDRPVPVWGWATAEEKVTVSFAGQEKNATAGVDGRWMLKLDALAASAEGRALTVAGSATANPVTVSNILVGEVWLCSGQSNMEWTVSNSQDAQKEIAAADFPTVRLFLVPKKISASPQNDVEAAWAVCKPDTIPGFSAVGYFFGRELHKSLNVPVGLIASAWGGTRIEPWTPPVGFALVPAVANLEKEVLLRDPHTPQYKERIAKLFTETEDWLAKAKDGVAKDSAIPTMPVFPPELIAPNNPQVPGALYNGMVNGFVPFALRGAIWYQGESNHGEGMLYTEKTKALVAGWRQAFQNPDMTYLYVQIAPFEYGTESPQVLAEFWEAQAAALAIPGTGMAVISDVGNIKDIHPRNKQEVGRRLALLALAKSYGKTDVICSGPTFKELKLEGARLRVTFANVGGGLVARDDKPLTNFEIIDADEGGFVPADAQIDNDSIVLSAATVKKPVAVRFAWHKTAEPNLANKDGLPAVPFRAGDVPKRDLLALNVTEARDYELVYDLDLAKLNANIVYDVDNSAKLKKPFDRIAYFIELQPKGSDGPQYLYVSMDAFTDDLTKIGIPTAASKATFQQNVANMNVLSNVKEIVAGVGLKGGNIEFWPNNYGPANGAKVPNADNGKWDFGDQTSDPVDGYGCMQVHNHDAKQTLFAINQWKAGKNADVGIGTCVNGQNPDWTFSRNADSYASLRLRVLVHPK